MCQFVCFANLLSSTCPATLNRLPFIVRNLLMPSAESEVAPSIRTATTFKTAGYAGHSTTSPLTPSSFERRDPGPNDVQIEILY
jgi:hypothetical protein